MKKQILTLIVGIASTLATYAQSTEARNALSNVDEQFFIENKGQWPDEVLYVTRIGGLDAWITKNGVLYDFYKLEEEQQSATTEAALPDKFEHKNYTKYGHRVWYKLKGNNIHVNAEGNEKQEGYYNYLIGNDPSKHASNVGLYKEATVKNVYNGIDVRYYFDKGSIRYDYVVYPGADPSQIAFTLEGTDNTYLNQEGNLVFNTRFGEVAIAELHTYQETKENRVNSHFEKKENSWSIVVDAYDINQILIIDPLIYSTYLGGSGDDRGTSIDSDASGNVYVTGYTASANYDSTTGAYQTNHGGGIYDVFVTKLNTTGTALVYSTYIGGSNDDEGNSIALDELGYVYITGWTTSTDYHITSGAYQTSNAGSYDVFVTKLNTTGTALIYSTYLGGSDWDFGNSIIFDESGNAYVTGGTTSLNYDITSGAYQSSNAGNYDVFVTKLNATGTALVYSTYLGGNDWDNVWDIVIDTSNYVYLTGHTESASYPTTSGAYQTSYAGYGDVFVTKLNTTGTALVYSTYIGGNSYDYGRSITVDISGNAYITGYTNSTNYDITSGAYQTVLNWNKDVFVTKLNPTGSTLIYSTYLGGSGVDSGLSIALDSSGNVYVTGQTKSTNYDITIGAHQTGYGGNWDVLVTKLNATGSALVYSTYIGDSGDDIGLSINIDVWGNVYVMGITNSTSYDTTAGAYQTSYAGGDWDIFVTKICLSADANISLISAAGTETQSVCINNAITNITYAITNTLDANVSGLPPGVNSNFIANVVTISGVPTASGKFDYVLTPIGGCGIISDTGNLSIKTVDVTVTNLAPKLTANATNATYQWVDCGSGFTIINGETNQNYTATSNGDYAVVVTQNGCTDTSACEAINNVGTNETHSENFKIYPNPANTEVSIKGKFTAPINIEIIDASGRISQAVYSHDNHTIKLNVSSLTNGMYCIRIVDKGEVFQSKIIVQH